VVGCCEHGDGPSGSGTMELVNYTLKLELNKCFVLHI
jgi:hypothetical protein